jgi:hypothetical protein
MLTRPVRCSSLFFLAPIRVDGHLLGLAGHRPPHKPGNDLDQPPRQRYSGNAIDNVMEDAFIMAAILSLPAPNGLYFVAEPQPSAR